MYCILLLVFVAAFSAAADVVTDWNLLALDSIRAAGTPPPAAARNLAILHGAIYDSVNGVHPSHAPFLVTTSGPEGASAEAAALAAARAILSALYPDRRAGFDNAYDGALARIAAGSSRNQGVSWGESVAAAVLAGRRDDGSAATSAYAPGVQPGQWRPTISFGGIVRPAMLPQWGNVTPFVIQLGAQFRPPAAPALNTAEYAEQVNYVKRIGARKSSVRTDEQTLIAQFWGYGPGSATPPGHWNQIAAAVSARHNSAGEARPNTLEENARLFALLNFALADAAIVSWDCKYTANFWRPITAIQEADTDGNDATTADREWAPLLDTPPFPEYTSGHSTFSAAAAVVLSDFFGTDRVQFEIGSDDLPGTTRSFATFTEAARESGISRIYGGIHFPAANRHGLSTGAAVGEYVRWNALLPLR